MSNALEYDYWIVGSPKKDGNRLVVSKASEPVTLTWDDFGYRYVAARFATEREAFEAKRSALVLDPKRKWHLIHVVNRRKKAEAQRDELLTLARKLVELEEWVASTMTSDARGMTIDVSWTGELANIIAEAKLALEKAQ